MVADKKKMVLIVDDNPENRKILGSLLVQNGYEVGVSTDGFKALEFVEKIEPDLILLDVMMPGMSGYEVCEKLKSDVRKKHIPIIFLTAKAETEDIVKGFEVGGVDYVTKPFNSAELLARVKTHIEIKTLRGLLPIYSSCKKIRNDEGFWESLEAYMNEHTDSQLSHSICPDCMKKLYGDQKWFKNSKFNANANNHDD